MASKVYRIVFKVDDAQAQQTIKRSTSGFEAMEKAAARAATAASAAAAKAGQAAQQATAAAVQGTAKRAKAETDLDALQDRLVQRDYARRARFEAQKERASERSAKSQERDAQRLDALQDRLVQRDYARRVSFERRKVEEAERAAAREERLRSKVLSDEQVELKVRDAIVDRHNQRRIDSALKAAGVERKSVADSTREALIGFGKQALALGGLAELARTYGQAVTDAGTKSKQLTADFVARREGLGELASILDRKVDNRLVLEQAKYDVDTGFKPEESKRFQASLMNSGAQFIGKNIGKDQAERFQVMAGQFAVANQMDPEIAGDLAGQILASTDYTKHGNKAAEQALGDLNTVFQIGKRGRGSNPVLQHQFVKAASTLLRENREEGIMASPADVMTGISVLAERNPEDAETFLRNASQGLRKFGDKKAGPLLQRAGITAKDDTFGAARKLAPVIRQEAQRRGLKDIDVLNESFDERESQGIATLIGKGIEGGAIEDRRAYGRQMGGAAQASRIIGEYQKSETYHDREAEAVIRQAQAERGAENSKLETARKYTLGRLIRDRKIDANGTNFRDYLVGKTSFGMLGSGEQVRIDEEVQRDIRAATPANAEKAPWSDYLNVTPTARESDLTRQIRRAEAAGGDPLEAMKRRSVQRDAGPGGAAGRVAAAEGPAGGGGWLEGLAGGAASFVTGAGVVSLLIKALQENTAATQQNTPAAPGGPKPIPRQAPSALPGAPRSGAMRP
jgi:hypothetical protein